MAYAVLVDLPIHGIHADALSPFSSAQQQAALDQGAAQLDSYLGRLFTLPLTSWAGSRLVSDNCIIATRQLMSTHGTHVDQGPDSQIEVRYRDVIRFYERLCEGKGQLPGVVDSTPNVIEGSPRVYSQEPRGW